MLAIKRDLPRPSRRRFLVGAAATHGATLSPCTGESPTCQAM